MRRVSHHAMVRSVTGGSLRLARGKSGYADGGVLEQGETAVDWPGRARQEPFEHSVPGRAGSTGIDLSSSTER